eukprot:TRINITY_DN24093_c0_g1_i1.p1 TRINITY_DN24093_c0_g1~~TRINITY_DN24093_c0_g1_i1.p1  ORF type:complete len:236 (-),score=21.94 TRINITY_DN24093_c0_g1_i1:27-734(-)
MESKYNATCQQLAETEKKLKAARRWGRENANKVKELEKTSYEMEGKHMEVICSLTAGHEEEKNELEEEKEEVEENLNFMIVSHCTQKDELSDAFNAAAEVIASADKGSRPLPIKVMGSVMEEELVELNLQEKVHHMRRALQSLKADWSAILVDDKVVIADKQYHEFFGESGVKYLQEKLQELYDYNPAGYYPVVLPWNQEEQRKMTPGEIIRCLAGQIKGQESSDLGEETSTEQT